MLSQLGALAVALGTAAAGASSHSYFHSVFLAVLTGVFGFLSLALAPLVSDFIKSKVFRRAKPTDHVVERDAETGILLDHYVHELDRVQHELDRLAEENDELRKEQHVDEGP